MKSVMPSIAVAAIAILPIFALAGCVDPINAKLAEPLSPQIFQWEAGNPPVPMALASTHVCLLTGIAGNFAGKGERVAMYVDQGSAGGPRWTLNGTSGQLQLRASATCINKAKFAPTMFTPAQMEAAGYPNQTATDCTTQFALMPGKVLNHAFFISGLAGQFRGNGEMVRASQNNGTGAISVTGCSGYVDGTLMSFGDSTVPLVKFRTQSGRTTDTGPATFVIALANESSSWLGELFGGPPFRPGGTQIWLTPVDEAVCGLVNVRGEFQGYGEALEIVVAKNSDGRLWWKFQLGNETNGGEVSGAARCVARDQR